MIKLDKPRFHTDQRTFRLSLTYFTVIAIVSLVFSGVLYQTSASRLHISQELHTLPDTPASSTPPAPNTNMNKQLQAVKHDWLQTLVLLNGVVYICGAGFSYLLARRTLRPIEAALESQDRFASDAAHELLTPLTTMQTEIEVTLRNHDRAPGRAVQALEHNLTQIIRLRDVSKALLVLAQSQQINKTVERVDLSEASGLAINHVINLASQKNITIHDRVTPSIAQGSAQNVRQAITILLENAIKYSPVASIITISVDSDPKHIVLQVADAGHGIDPSELSYVFERFYRTKAARASKDTGGHGLGLALAQQLIKQSGGFISVASRLGQGSTFSVHLPKSS